MTPLSGPVAGQPLAVAAASLYLANLLVAPLLAFGLLAWLWVTRRHAAPPLARVHLDQAFIVSLRGGLVLALLAAGFVLLDGADLIGREWTWTLIVVYFTCVHSVLVMLGIVALSRAMAGRPWRHPWIGPRHEAD